MQGASSYRCIVFSKSASPSRSSIQVVGPLEEPRVRLFADSPGLELSIAIYAVDKEGYPTLIGSARRATKARRPYYADATRPLYAGLALGPAATTENEAGSVGMLRLEPSLLYAVIPGAFLLGAECQIDLGGSGAVKDWQLCPLMFSGDLNHGFYDIYKLGFANRDSRYSLNLGYGEGVGKFFVLPSLELSRDSGGQGPISVRSFSISIGSLF